MTEKKNELFLLKTQIPPLEKECARLMEENKRLYFEVERFESPIALMEKLSSPLYSSLVFPYQKDVIVREGKKEVNGEK